MIYAQIDVEIRDHERIWAACADLPPDDAALMRDAILGAFTWSLCWCYAKMSDGQIPKALLENGRHPEVVRRMASVELIVLDGGVYRVRNFEKKNPTREQREKKIEATAARKDAHNKRKKGQSSPPGQLDLLINSLLSSSAPEPSGVRACETGTRSERVPAVSGSRSLSVSSDLEIDREDLHSEDRSPARTLLPPPPEDLQESIETLSEPEEATRPQAVSETRLRAAPRASIEAMDDGPAERLPLDSTCPPEWAATAEMIPITDVALVWTKFVGHYATKAMTRLERQGRWLKWCAEESQRQRNERERQRTRLEGASSRRFKREPLPADFQGWREWSPPPEARKATQ